MTPSKYGTPILQKWISGGRDPVLTIYGSKYKLGTAFLGGRPVGYLITCGECDWNRRVNDNLRAVRQRGRAHARVEHGIKGMEDV